MECVTEPQWLAHTVTRLQARRPRKCISFLAWVRDSSILQNIKTNSGIHSVSYWADAELGFQGGKVARVWSWLLLSSANIQDVLCCTCIPWYAFMACTVAVKSLFLWTHLIALWTVASYLATCVHTREFWTPLLCDTVVLCVHLWHCTRLISARKAT